jgi:hypothetical protein
MVVFRILCVIAGIAILGGTGSSVIRTLVVPRGVASKMSDTVLSAVVRVTRSVSDLAGDYERRDQLLAWSAPITLMALLASWLFCFALGYTLIDFGISRLTFWQALRQAGSSIATLGFATSDKADLTVFDVFAGLTGMIVIALQIAYLPTLYSAYNQRETLVTLLAARGGEPAWGPEILWRHSLLNLLDNLPELYRSWETWSATVSESHTSYPVLVHFRSPQPLRSWLISLLAVMDSASMQLALAPTTAPIEARLLLRMGFLALRDISAVEGIPIRMDPSPDDEITLTFAEFSEAADLVVQGGLPTERGAEEAWPDFRGWRINYEDAVYGLARHIDAVPALWSGPRRRPGDPIPPVRLVNRKPSRGLDRARPLTPTTPVSPVSPTTPTDPTASAGG